MRGFQLIHDELQSLGARVAGVSIDTWASQQAFAEQQGFEFPLLSDWPDLKTIDAFGIRREGRPTPDRTTFVFDAEGVVRAVINDTQDMDAHPQGALAAVKALAAG